MDNLKSLTQKENIILSDIALEKFEIYKKLILEWNEKINLTAITDEEESHLYGVVLSNLCKP